MEVNLCSSFCKNKPPKKSKKIVCFDIQIILYNSVNIFLIILNKNVLFEMVYFCSDCLDKNDMLN